MAGTPFRIAFLILFAVELYVMKSTRTFRPLLSQLEDRSVPALTATISNNVLCVTGTPVGSVTITAAAAASPYTAWTVTDSGDGSFTVPAGNKRDLKVVLGSGTDTVVYNQAGVTSPGSVTISTGNGGDTITVNGGGGAIQGGLCILGGNGTDTVTIGNLTVGKNTNPKNLCVNLGGSIDDTLTLNNVTVIGSLYTYYVNDITTSGGSISRSAVFYGGAGGNEISLSTPVGTGSVGDVIFLSYPSVTQTKNTLQVNSPVARDVRFTSAVANEFGDEVTINAAVGRDVAISGGNKADIVNINANVGRNLYLYMTKGGDDQITVAAAATITRTTFIYLGTDGGDVTFLGDTGSGVGTQAFYLSTYGSTNLTFAASTTINGRGTARFYGGSNNVFISGSTRNDVLTLFAGGATVVNNIDVVPGPPVANLVLIGTWV